MNVRDLMEVFVRHRTDQPVMVSPGNSGTVLHHLGHREPTLYNLSLSYAGPTCFGLALARPDLKVVAVEGDGSLIAGLGFLTTLARYPLENLVVLVIDNGRYLSTDRGALATATASGADLHTIARGAGIEKVAAASTVDEVDQWLGRALREKGPFVIVARVDPTGRLVSPPRPHEPDRTEASLMFRRWLIEHPAPDSGAPWRGAPSVEGPAPEEGPGRASARLIYQALKDAGVNLLVYLPDSILYPVQEIAECDPEMRTIACAREDEGVAIAGGAYYGGLTPALVTEGSGVGYSGLALANCIVRRTPLLVVASHTESLGVRFDHDTTSRLVNEPILRALHIPYEVLTRAADAPALMRESVHQMGILKEPVGVVVPPYVMSDRGLRPI